MKNSVSEFTFSVIFPLISTKSYVVTICWNCLDEGIPMNSDSIGIGKEINWVLFEMRTAEYISVVLC